MRHFFTRQILLIFSFLYAFTNIICAAEYRSDVSSTYTFTDNSTTSQVEHQFTLTNTNATVFVSHYQLVLPEKGLGSINFDPQKESVDKSEHTDHDYHLIDLDFTNEVVGQGKARQFSLSYNDRSLAKERGSSRVITIPPLPGSSELTTYQREIHLPVGYGEPTTIFPTPTRTATASGQLVYIFDGHQDETLTFTFGQEQILSFVITYTLHNTSNYPAYRDLTLPANQDGITFIYRDLYPGPLSFALNDDHTWTGHYLLDVGQQLIVTADGYVRVGDVSRDFELEKIYPQLNADISLSSVSHLPPELNTDETADLVVDSSVDTLGIWPLLHRYRAEIYNASGFTRQSLQARIKPLSDNVEISPTNSDLLLLPWTKSVIIYHLRPKQWWQLYTRFAAHLTISDHQGQIINEHDITGLSISYPACAALGAIVGLATVAGSILVARRKSANSLRRQSEKSSQSAQLVSSSGPENSQNEGNDEQSALSTVADPPERTGSAAGGGGSDSSLPTTV